MWYQVPRWRNRLIAEQALMRERFPHFVLCRDASDRLVWRGILVPFEEGPGFLATLVLPSDYPYASPQLFVERPAIRPDAPHLHADGTLCIYKDDWSPGTGTAASVLPLAAVWLLNYLLWIATGEVW